jgi:hypothetical protein
MREEVDAQEELEKWAAGYMTVSYGAGLVVSYSGQCVGECGVWCSWSVGGRASCGAAGRVTMTLVGWNYLRFTWARRHWLQWPEA